MPGEDLFRFTPSNFSYDSSVAKDAELPIKRRAQRSEQPPNDWHGPLLPSLKALQLDFPDCNECMILRLSDKQEKAPSIGWAPEKPSPQRVTRVSPILRLPRKQRGTDRVITILHPVMKALALVEGHKKGT